MVMAALWALIGAAGGAVTALVLLKLPEALRWRLMQGLIALIVIIYVGFAFAYGDGRAIALEAVIAIGFILFSQIFWPRRALVLPGLLLAHAGLDIAHLMTGSPIAPQIYAQLCVGYDVALGLIAYFLFSNSGGPAAKEIS